MGTWLLLAAAACLMRSASSFHVIEGGAILEETESVKHEKVMLCYMFASELEASLKKHPFPEFLCLCSRLVILKAELLQDGFISVENPMMWKALMQKLLMLRMRLPHLKVVVSVRGGAAYSMVARNPLTMLTCSRNLALWQREYGCDGFEIDWQYPGIGSGSSPMDRVNLPMFLRALEREMDKVEGDSVLMLRVGYEPSLLTTSYIPRDLGSCVEYISLDVLDMHDSTLATTGFNAPLYYRPGDKDRLNNVDAIVKLWKKAGMPLDKMVVNVPVFGTTYQLANDLRVDVGAPTVGPGPPCWHTQEAGVMSYKEICDLVTDCHNDWESIYNQFSMVPYSTDKRTWVSHEDMKSVTSKALYVEANELGGVGVYTIDSDDDEERNMKMLANLVSAVVPLLLPLLLVEATQEGGYRVVCYYGSWAVYRPGNGKFDVEDIDPTLCTHLIYGFVGLGEDDTVRVLDSWNDLPDNYGKGAMARFVKLKERSPTTKVMVSIGGWNEGSTKYSDMASSEARRTRFADNAVTFVKKYGFDGLDLDWEYPAQRGGKTIDKDNFPKLLETVYNKFHENGLLFTAAFGASLKTVNLSYIIPEVSKYLDFINVMTYDYHGSWDTSTGESAPLYAHPTDTSDEGKTMNIDTCVQNLLALGAPPEKLNLGMGTYGHSFTLQDPAKNGVNAPITGPGEAGPYTRQTGTIGYNEICEQKGKWTLVWNDVQQVPYAYSSNQWIGYDNVKSIQIKSEYLKEKKFGGAMVWSLETDDFRNVCGEGKNPLLHTINAVLNGGTLPTGAPQTTAAPQPGGGGAGGQTPPTTTPTPAQPTEPLPPATELCDHSGYVRDKNDCQVFYECVASGSQYLVYKFKCADGTYFDTTIDQCNFADDVKC